MDVVVRILSLELVVMKECFIFMVEVGIYFFSVLFFFFSGF